MFSLQNRKAALCPDFSQPHHGIKRRRSHTLVPSVKRRITAAGQDPAPNAGLVKTRRAVGTMCPLFDNSADTCLWIDCSSVCDRSEVSLPDIRKRLAAGYR